MLMKLSIVIPAHNEEVSITDTVQAVTRTLDEIDIDYELIVVNDNSTDATTSRVEYLQA